MKTMRFAITAVWILLLIGCGEKAHVVSLDSDHAVMESAVISFVDFGNAGDSYTLDETPTLWRWLKSDEQDLEGLRARLHEIDELDQELVKNFLSANESPAVFDQKQFPDESRLITFSEAAKKRIFTGDGKGWTVFESEFGPRGIVSLTRPGYSADRNTTLIAIWHHRHSEWSRGIFLRGERMAGNWVFREVQSTGG